MTYLSDLNTFSVYPLNIYGKNKVSNIKIEFNVFNYNISSDFKFLILIKEIQSYLDIILNASLCIIVLFDSLLINNYLLLFDTE